MFNKIENDKMEEFFSAYILRNKTAYILILSVIIAFECIMMVWGLVFFDFSRARHVLYFCSYIFLLVVTLTGLIVTKLHIKGKVSPHLITLALHGYCTAIIAWSLVVSHLDLQDGNSAIVYLTVIMSIGGLSAIHPIYYGLNLLISLGFLFAFERTGYFATGDSGVYINLIVFSIVSFLLAIRQYRISRRELELTQSLERMSYSDQLTGILNRRSYDETVKQVEKTDEEVLVGMLDLDKFKRINDQWGHAFGDECLQAASSLLREAFGERIFRIGGDEFAVICPIKETVEEKVDAINRSLAERFPGRNIAVSAGFAGRRKGEAMAATMRNADNALYTAKADTAKSLCFAHSSV